ncbi:MAG: hypothetical protein DRG78_24130 [Epsilonproteobacteria bacterium]|nr:MAG: hypothetical protein DRG78_24130 [Campylobacterota bacterium]
MDIGFLLKKFITFFVEPYGMIFSLFILGFYFLFIKKEKLAKIFMGLSLSLLFLFSYQPFSNFLITNLENQYPKYDYQEDIKYIHVLGAGHNTDNSQPLSSRNGSAGTKRVLEGIIIHLRTPNSKLIFTGYEGHTDVGTGRMHADLAIALGVKEENIIVNSMPKDTKEEAIYTKSLVANSSFVLVTSATHMPRSMRLFKSLGLHPIAAPTDYHKDETSKYFRAPDINNLYNSQVAIHEYIGMLWGIIKS